MRARARIVLTLLSYLEVVNDIKTHRRYRRSTSFPKKTVEVLIAADYKMFEFYDEDVLPSYILAVVNIVSHFLAIIPYLTNNRAISVKRGNMGLADFAQGGWWGGGQICCEFFLT